MLNVFLTLIDCRRPSSFLLPSQVWYLCDSWYQKIWLLHSLSLLIFPCACKSWTLTELRIQAERMTTEPFEPSQMTGNIRNETIGKKNKKNKNLSHHKRMINLWTRPNTISTTILQSTTFKWQTDGVKNGLTEWTGTSSFRDLDISTQLEKTSQMLRDHTISWDFMIALELRISKKNS